MTEDLDHLAALADDVRRAAYRLVADRGPAGADRNEVAVALGISRSLAAYHLDRLVDDGLVVARFEHRGERRGPGSGRPSKVYERARTEFAVTLPPRDYELAARVMADALDGADDAARRSVAVAASAEGRRLRAAAADGSGHEEELGEAPVERLLGRCGYEPYERDGAIRLRNCPFDALARHHRSLVCSMNLALLEGLLEREVAAGCSVQLDPTEGECCVTIRPRR